MKTFFDTNPRTPRISKDAIESLYMIREQCIEDRQPLVSLYQHIGKYFSPDMQAFNPDQDTGQPVPLYADVHDNTGARASDDLANGIYAYGFSRSAAWMRLVTEDPDVMKNSEVREWLQQMELHLYRQFYQSGWYNQAIAMAKTCADFATAVMMRSNDIARGLPIYRTLNPNYALIMEDANGEADTLIREFWMTAFDAAGEFGYDNLPERIQQAFRDGSAARHLFHQFIFPLEKFDLDIDRKSTKGMPYYDLIVPDCDHAKPQQEGGHDNRPFFVWRWSRSPAGGPYGVNSPGMLAISDAMQLSGMAKDARRAEQLSTRPPIKRTAGLRVNLTPNGMTDISQGQDFAPVHVIGSVQVSEDAINRIQKQVRETYHRDLLLVLTSNIERLKTATEVEAIKGEQSAMLTAFQGRMSTEFQEPSVEDLFHMEIESGRAPPPPRGVQGRTLKIDLVSPLNQLQKRYLLQENTKQFLAEVMSIVSDKGMAYKAGLDRVDLDEYISQAAELYHVNEKILRDLSDVALIRRIRAEQQKALLQVELQEKAAKAQATNYQAARQAPEAGSPAAQTMGQEQP